MGRVSVFVAVLTVAGCVAPGGSRSSVGGAGGKADSAQTPDEIRDTFIGEHRAEEPLGDHPIGFTFTASAGVAFSVTASAAEVPIAIEVWGPASETVTDDGAADVDWGRRLGETAGAPALLPRIIVPAEGAYLLIVSAGAEEAVAKFDLTVASVEKVLTPVVLEGFVHGRRIYDDRDRAVETWREACRLWRDGATESISAVYGEVLVAPVAEGVDPQPFTQDAALRVDGCEAADPALTDHADAGNVYNFSGPAELVFEVRTWDAPAAIFPARAVGAERQSNDDDPGAAIDSYQQACADRLDRARAVYGKRFIVGSCGEPEDLERFTGNVWRFAGQTRIWLHSEPEWKTRIEVPGFVAGSLRSDDYRRANDSWVDACEELVADTAEAAAETAAVVVDRAIEGHDGLHRAAGGALVDAGWYVVPAARVSDERAREVVRGGEDAAGELRAALEVDVLAVVTDASSDGAPALVVTLHAGDEPVARVVEATPEAWTSLLHDAVADAAPAAPEYARLEWHTCGVPEDRERSVINRWQLVSDPVAHFAIETDRHVVERELEATTGRDSSDLQRAVASWTDACRLALDAARASLGPDFVVGGCGEPEDIHAAGNVYRFRSVPRAWVLSDEPSVP